MSSSVGSKIASDAYLLQGNGTDNSFHTCTVDSHLTKVFHVPEGKHVSQILLSSSGLGQPIVAVGTDAWAELGLSAVMGRDDCQQSTLPFLTHPSKMLLEAPFPNS